MDSHTLETIEMCADRILEETGLRLEGDQKTLDVCRANGFNVTGDVVRFNGRKLRTIIQSAAPSVFTIRGRNPQHDTIVGSGRPPVVAPVYGPPNFIDTDNTRRLASSNNYRKLVELAHDSIAITNTGHMLCVLNDVPNEQRPYEMALAHLECSDKPFLGPASCPDSIKNVSWAVRQVYNRPDSASACNLLHLINSTPPLVYKSSSLKCLRAAARSGEGVIVTSYMMLGATSPSTTAGTLAQGYAEVLVGLALAQIWRPGTPVILGMFGTPFHMTQMVPAFGDPTSSLIQLYSSELARQLGIPSRGDGGSTSAKVDDAQAGYDGGRAILYALASGANFVLHSAGWLEHGRTSSYAKFKREADALSIHIGAKLEVPPPRQSLDQETIRELRRRWRLNLQ
ncbi:trimethylamine--corrinoid methyltransferase [Tabrizicola sp. TH137]|uniref:trimethylamine methyltransferase family protein n=1 Tax=Tabrizicola sp. TH137 TaxID=2067452 RepID=UPI000C7C5F04|nr:trimethylamine--corrinoid methyltransferase [Tabrizicola sp. TH137]